MTTTPETLEQPLTKKEKRKARREARKARHKGFFKEFAEFINKGNVVQLAVGVVIGAAFKAITSALVDGIIMPLISMVIPGNFADDGFVLKAATEDASAVVLQYGQLIQAILDFLIIAFTIFLVLRIATKVGKFITKRKEEALVRIKELRDELEQKIKEGWLSEEDKQKEAELHQLEAAQNLTPMVLEEPVAETPAEPELEAIEEPKVDDVARLLGEIRDLLAKKGTAE